MYNIELKLHEISYGYHQYYYQILGYPSLPNFNPLSTITKTLTSSGYYSLNLILIPQLTINQNIVPI
jgi:hypothetical protein